MAAAILPQTNGDSRFLIRSKVKALNMNEVMNVHVFLAKNWTRSFKLFWTMKYCSLHSWHSDTSKSSLFLIAIVLKKTERCVNVPFFFDHDLTTIVHVFFDRELIVNVQVFVERDLTAIVPFFLIVIWSRPSTFLVIMIWPWSFLFFLIVIWFAIVLKKKVIAIVDRLTERSEQNATYARLCSRGTKISKIAFCTFSIRNLTS